MSTKSSVKSDSGAPKDLKVTFKCRLCGKNKPIEDMRVVARFNPVLIACQDCAKTL